MKYIDAEKLKAEIERLKNNSELAKKEWVNEGYNQNAFAEDCRIGSFNTLLSFLDSLADEPVAEGLEEEIDRYLEPLRPCDIQEAPFTSMENIARHFAEWGCRTFKVMRYERSMVN